MSKTYISYGTGRRKNATARIYLSQGTGQFVINGRTASEYLKRKTLELIANQPFQITNTAGKYDVFVNIAGGGLTGQAGAIRHGLSRALVALDSAMRPSLKKAGYLTRDPRMVERKKYGRPGARKRFQFSKR